jgi:preprotein translocase subunit SecG
MLLKQQLAKKETLVKITNFLRIIFIIVLIFFAVVVYMDFYSIKLSDWSSPTGEY